MVRRHGDASHGRGARIGRRRPRSASELPIGGFLAIVVVYLAIIKGVGALMESGLDGFDGHFRTTEQVALALLVPIGVSVVFVYAVVAALGWWRPVFVDDRPVQRWVWVVPAIFALAIVVGIDYADLADKGVGFVSLLLLGALCVGFAEEGMFRGIGVTAFREHGLSEARVALWSSVVFGAVHLTNALSSGGAAVGQAIAVSFAGYFFYLTRRVSGGLLVPAVSRPVRLLDPVEHGHRRPRLRGWHRGDPCLPPRRDHPGRTAPPDRTSRHSAGTTTCGSRNRFGARHRLTSPGSTLWVSAGCRCRRWIERQLRSRVNASFSCGWRQSPSAIASIARLAWSPSRESVAIWLAYAGRSTMRQSSGSGATPAVRARRRARAFGEGRVPECDDALLVRREFLAKGRADGLPHAAARMRAGAESDFGQVAVVHVARQHHDRRRRLTGVPTRDVLEEFGRLWNVRWNDAQWSRTAIRRSLSPSTAANRPHAPSASASSKAST